MNDVLLLAALQAADADDWETVDAILSLADNPDGLKAAVAAKGDDSAPADTFPRSS